MEGGFRNLEQGLSVVFHVYDVYFHPCFYDNFVSRWRNSRRSISSYETPEPLGSQGELIVYPSASVRRTSSTIFKDHYCETAWPIKAKFYVEPP